MSEFVLNLSYLISSLSEENDRLKAENHHKAAIIAKNYEDLGSTKKILDEKNRELEVLQKENFGLLADKTDRLRKLNQLLAQTGHQIREIDSLIISNSELKKKNSKIFTEKLSLETHNNALELQVKHLRRKISQNLTENAKLKKRPKALGLFRPKRTLSSGILPLPKKKRRKIILESDDE